MAYQQVELVILRVKYVLILVKELIAVEQLYQVRLRLHSSDECPCQLDVTFNKHLLTQLDLWVTLSVFLTKRDNLLQDAKVELICVLQQCCVKWQDLSYGHGLIVRTELLSDQWPEHR